MTVAEQNALHDAAAQVADELGLASIPKSSWTMEQRVQYLTHFITLVKANPEHFSSETLATVNVIHPENLYYDYSADFDLNMTNALLPAVQLAQTPADVANALLDGLKGLSSGVSSIGKMLPLLLPLFAVMAVVLSSKSVARKTESALTF